EGLSQVRAANGSREPAAARASAGTLAGRRALPQRAPRADAAVSAFQCRSSLEQGASGTVRACLVRQPRAKPRADPCVRLRPAARGDPRPGSIFSRWLATQNATAARRDVYLPGHRFAEGRSPPSITAASAAGPLRETDS